MKKLILTMTSVLLCLTACYESMEDRAVREAQEYTEKNCPTPPDNNTVLDSLTFDRATHTFGHYQTLSGQADVSAAIFETKRHELHDGLVKEVKSNLNYKLYIDEGYHFAFICRSQRTGDVLFVDTVKNGEIR